PIPRLGEGEASGFPQASSISGARAQFQWSAALTGPVEIPAGGNATVLYSTEYEADTTKTDTFLPASGIGDFGDVRTVRIEYAGDMPSGTIHDFVLALAIDGDELDKQDWAEVGATNYYRSTVSYKIDKVTHWNQTSQAVAAKLASGIVIGRVYRDVNRSGSFDPDDSPVVNAYVSPSVVGGPTFDAAGGVSPVALSPVATNADGYYLIAATKGDQVRLTVNNPEFMPKTLRFMGESEVTRYKTFTVTAAGSADVLAGGMVGLYPPYRITFDDNRPTGTGANTTWDSVLRYEGEALSDPHEVADTLTAPPTPSTVPGWSFSRWYTNPQNSNGTAPAQWKANADTTFYAVRAPIEYTVNYDLNGADSPGSLAAKTAVRWSDDGLLPTASVAKQGYSLSWDVSLGGPTGGGKTGVLGTEKYSDLAAADQGTKAGAITLKARWTPNPAGVVFYNNHNAADQSEYAAGNEANAGAVVGGKLIKPADPTRQGYAFSGWFEDRNATKAWNFEANTVPTSGNVALYAKWTPNDATVVFYNNLGGGDTSVFDPGATANTDKKVGERLTEPSQRPERSGYTFQGWYKDSAAQTAWNFGADLVPVTGAVTLYAKWQANTYRVSFDANGAGATTPSPASKDVVYGSAYGDFPAPSREGYQLEGWYTVPTGGQRVASTDAVRTASAHTLYAHWTGNAATVKFYNNTYYVDDDDETNDDNTEHAAGATANAGKRVGDKLTLPPPPERAGYVFNGWTADRAGQSRWDFDGFVVPTSGVVELYATWGEKGVTVSFDPGPGAPKPNNVEAAFGGRVQTVNPTPTREGYRLAGWNVVDSGANWIVGPYGTILSSANGVVGADTDNPTLSLVARWELSSVAVSFDTAGGSAPPPPTTGQYNSPLTAAPSPAPTKAGYTLTGWRAADKNANWVFGASGTALTAANGVANASSGAPTLTLVAQWKPKRVAVSFDLAGGAGAPPGANVDYGSRLTVPTPPTKAGYSFAGWRVAGKNTNWDFGSSGTVLTAENGVAGASEASPTLVLVAQWAAKTVEVTFDAAGGAPAPAA
ncbi:MAG: InlB B-repeat-containing protein, partial [Bifidobacteriaceae bacterium]|nr:InlB B-repeat-containing protein [Bifidobacteriaceae bacterium]